MGARVVAVRQWATALVLLADVALAVVLYGRASLVSKILALVVLIPGAIYGFRIWRRVLRRGS